MRKIIYTNENGISAELGDKPFLMQKLSGFETSKNIIYTTKGVLQNGQKKTGSCLDMKERTITGTMKADTMDGLEERRRFLEKVFTPSGTGKLHYICGDFEKFCMADVESIVFGDIGIRSQPFDIVLLSTNPNWQDLTQSKTEIAQWIGNFHFPLAIPKEGIIMGYHTPSLIVNVKNPGDISCGMHIQFRALATLTNPSLFNVDTREYFKVTKTMQAGEIIDITTEFGNKRVTSTFDGVTSNAMQYIRDTNVTFLQLSPGDNYFRYNADSGLDSLECTITFNAQTLGV